MTQEALDSPGCTRAVITTARRALRAAGSLQKEVMVIRSQAFPARVSQSLRRRRRRTMLGSSRGGETCETERFRIGPWAKVEQNEGEVVEPGFLW